MRPSHVLQPVSTTARVALLWGLTLACSLSLGSAAQAGTIDPRVQAAAAAAGSEGTLAVILHLRDRAPIAQLDADLKLRHATRHERHAAVVRALQAAAERSQAPLIALLAAGRSSGTVIGFTPYWISNLIVARLRPGFLETLAARPDIDRIEPSLAVELIAPVVRGRWWGDPEGEEALLHERQIGVTPGLRAINADRCWYELGLSGAGRLICGLDTGVDGTHPALETKWRGYGGAHPPEECWYDCLADTVGPPYDASEHGTHTMGTMCGLAGEDTVGVAWGAQWIAANAIGQAGWNEAFDNDIIACFQWIADPDGDPETVDDVPDVCQNSWGGREFPPENSYYHRCDDLWWAVIDNCEASGVIVTFSAGNEQFPLTTRIPADRVSTDWNTYAVGAVDATNYPFPYPLATFSSQGPSPCDEVTIKPEVSAPGVDVVSTIPGGDYAPMSGTSMAGPHVAGVVALMREIDPDIESDRAKQILMDTSVDHGDPGEDNAFGWGVIDAYAACLAVMNGYGNVSGRVTETPSGLALPGAAVSVPQLARTVRSDADGDFDLRHLPAGAWPVVTTLFGYDPDTTIVLVEPEGHHPLAIALASQPRGDLAGVVGDGVTGIAGARMQLLGVPVPVTPTAADGSYAFDDLPAGGYTLVAGLFGWAPQTRAVEIAAGGVHVEDFRMLSACDDDFEVDQGWIVGADDDDAYEGIWERADPNPTYFGPQEVQPADDHSADGTLCFVTHNQPAGSPRFFGDVDGGRTTLLSPVFDATAASFPLLTYWRWFHSASGYPTNLEFRCDVSMNAGETWINVDTYTAGDGGWDQVVVSLSQPPLHPTARMQVRFVAEDDAHGTGMVEAAVDDVEVTGFPSSAGAHEMPLVLRLDAPRPNPLGGGAVLSFTLPRAEEAELGIFDPAGRRVRRLVSGAQEAGEQRVYWDGRNQAGRALPSGVYFLRLAAENRELSRKLILAR